jgi:spore coat polysaccharide biosynthesis predicted glycosyltransferase SpsG
MLMIKSILFRIDNSKDSGLGHIARSYEIGLHLKILGIPVFYVIDEPWPIEFESRKPPVEELVELCYISSHSEIEFLAELFQLHDITHVVVDSFKITAEWFEAVNKLEVKMYVLDDSNQGLNSYVTRIPYGIRFQGSRTQTNTAIGEMAIKNVVLTSPRNSSYDYGRESDIVRVFVYLGANPLEIDVVKVFGSLFRNSLRLKRAVHLVSIRTENLNENLIQDLYLRNGTPANTRFTLVEFSDDLSGLVLSCDLVIGASNSVLYCTARCKIPQISFPLNETQRNDDYQLEQIGHFFNLSGIDDFDDNNFGVFLNLLLENLLIPRSLLLEANNCPDYSGAAKIANLIVSQPSKVNDVENQNESCSRVGSESNSGFFIREARHNDVNLILEARNMESTRKFMLKKDKISKPAHYAWWLSNTRDNFIGQIGDSPCIYIWHQLQHIRGIEYLIGGWIPLVPELHLSVVLEALKWQMNLTSQIYPKSKWVAAVHRENSATRFLVNRIGFVECAEGSDSLLASKEFFLGDTNSQDFVFYSS